MRDLPESDYNFTSKWSDFYQQVIRVLQYQEMIKGLPASNERFARKWLQFYQHVINLYQQLIRVLQ